MASGLAEGNVPPVEAVIETPATTPDPHALRVSATSRPASVAGAIAGVVREHGRAEIQVIGAAAINQAIKAVAIARGYLLPAGIDLVCVPSFVDVQVNANERTAIRLILEPR